MKEYVAIDLGASNGRAILGRFDGRKLVLEELNRFENNYVRVGDSYFWDLLLIYNYIQDGLRQFAKRRSGRLEGIGIDTWGVDFGLLDKQGRIVGNPRAYRDPRGERGMRAFHGKYGERSAFDKTGIANMQFNTLYQLYDMVTSGDPQLQIADKLLTMPDLLGYLLCGVPTIEYTFATTTQLLDARTGQWSKEVLDMCGISPSLFAPIQRCGEVKGPMLKWLAADLGLANRPDIICVGSHDTASAVASIPALTSNFAFISSGTWSLIGIVSDRAIVNDFVYQNHFSNEGTVDGGYRPLRNIMGLWIIQSCKRQWDTETKLSWDDIVGAAQSAPAFGAFIDVNESMFFDGDNMPQKVQQYCEDSGQPVPQTKGEIARTVYESLAMSYREAFAGLEQLAQGRLDTLHIVGGGSKNRLLNEMTAGALNREVVAGPAEATAIGNLVVQMKAGGEVGDAAEVSSVIRNSFGVEIFSPRQTEAWSENYERYLRIKALYRERKN
jgi:sugar (pentulose or hexulose) kinase